ncbi:MAG: hypothetical protein HYZ69_01325 [Candidatus Colwellbacteria bacterium]|nr:hypothetical protein [Candidatus Colwellbacteria bacterium]
MRRILVEEFLGNLYAEQITGKRVEEERSLVRNSSNENALIEIQEASNKTKERQYQEHETKRKKDRLEQENDLKAQYHRSVVILAERWYKIEEEELKNLSKETRQKFESMIYERSKKSLRRKIPLLAVLHIGIFAAPIVCMGIVPGIVLGTIFAFVCTPMWFSLDYELTMISSRKKIQRLLE